MADYYARIPDAVVRRLPGYFRHLCELEAGGTLRLSSQALGKRMGLTASQIRQDINCFGGFGQQGYGYHVPSLKQYIEQILGIDKMHTLVIAGAGNIGTAIANYPAFQNEGFHVLALFDQEPARVGVTIQGAPIFHISELEKYLAEHKTDILVIATPPESAQEVADLAARSGVRAIWNFAPVDLSLGEEVEIANVHLSDSLMSLSFRLHEREVRKTSPPQWVKETE